MATSNSIAQGNDSEEPDVLLLVRDGTEGLSCLDLVRSVHGLARTMAKGMPQGVDDVDGEEIDRLQDSVNGLAALTGQLVGRIDALTVEGLATWLHENTSEQEAGNE